VQQTLNVLKRRVSALKRASASVNGQPCCEGCSVPYDTNTFRSFESRPGELHYLCGGCWKEKFDVK